MNYTSPVKIVFVIAAFLLSQLFLMSQTISKISANSNFYVECKKISGNKIDGFLKRYRIKAYYIPKQEPVLNFTLSAHEDIENLNISSSGHLVSLEFPHQTHVYNVITKAEVKYIKGMAKVHFPNYDHFFLIDGIGLRAYESNTGNEIMTYKNSGNRAFDRELIFSQTDQHIILRASSHSFFLWKVGDPKRYKKFNGSLIRFDYNDQMITVLNTHRIQAFSMKDLRLNFEYDLNIMAREYEKQQKGKGNSVSVKSQSSLLSPAGNFALVPFTNNEKKCQFLLVSSRRKQYAPLSFEMEPYDSCRWLTDSSLIFHFKNTPSKIMLFSDTKPRLIEVKEKNDVSPDNTLWAKESFGFLRKKIKVNTLSGETEKVKASEFIAFSPNNKVLVAKRGKKKGVIFLHGNDRSFHPFKDSLIPMTELELTEEDPPPGYMTNKIDTFININQKLDSTKIHLVLKNVERQDSIVKVNVHLMDAKGNYYYGASDEKWKNIWCNFVLKNKGQGLRQITNFTVTEHQAADSLPCAIIVALDHSGSMGDRRAHLIQKATKNFIEKKFAGDVLGVIKYDSRIKLEANPSSHKEDLLDNLKMDGLKGFGGGTSLLDAANEAIMILKKIPGETRKAVVLLTDGNENSSRSTMVEVIKRALDNNIKIHCLGFGKNVSEGYLTSISDGTDGSFYHIYKRGDFNWIFEDIYRKMSNYYEVKFKLEDYGKFMAYLKICYGNGDDVLGVDLKRTEPVKKPGEKEAAQTDAETETALKENISDLSGVVSKNEENYNAKPTMPDTVDIVQLEEEFDKLIFPNIKFKLDLSEIVPGTDKGIENVVEFMKRYPFTRIEIEGHTDDDGDEAHNLTLSLQRAQAVKKLLQSMGVEGDRLSTAGYGEDRPLVPNTSEENRLKNRRVEFVILAE